LILKVGMERLRQNKLIFGIVCALVCETLFGLSYMFTKTAIRNAGVFALLGWRFFLAIILSSILVKLGVMKINLKGKSLRPLLIVAICSPCLYFFGETLGLKYTTASESGVFLGCIPVVSLIASTVILKKKPSVRQVIGILITMFGVIITVLAVGLSSSMSFIGYSFLTLSVISYALYSVSVEKAAGYSISEITYVMLLLGATVFIILAIGEALLNGNMNELLMLPFTNREFAVSIVYQGIGCSVIAFFLYNIAVTNIGVNRAASFIGFSTVVSIISGTLALKESFTLPQIIGAIIIITGVYIANAEKEVSGESKLTKSKS